ncbi:MAG: SsrA-binding protein SmpB [Endomicrobium sp.]|jgi:SsrA-binding protein|nr:SsrA-binding protein SmpB [Endomicrobium sp.]
MKKVFSLNKKAYYNYEIIEKLETGIVLCGYEVKAIKCSNVSLTEGIVGFYEGEAFVENMSIASYRNVSTHVYGYDAKRRRKLLMHKIEISKMQWKVRRKGFSVIPLEIYSGCKGRIKLLVGLVKGKKMYNKKDIIKKRDIMREVERLC